MSIAERAATATAGQSTVASFTVPAACQAGDLIIIHFYTNIANALTIPAGYTQLGSTLTPGTAQQSFVCFKIASSGDGGATVTVGNGGTAKWSVTISVYSGCNQTTPIDTANSSFVAETAAGTHHDSPSEAVSGTDSWAVWGVADRQSPGSTTFTVATGTIRSQTSGIGGGGSSSQAVADSAGVVASGTLAADQWTGTVSTQAACMFTIILLAATSATTTAVTSVFGQFDKALLDAAIAGCGAGVPQLVLMGASYVFDQDAQVYWADISADEVAAGGGYTASGQPLTTPTTPYDTGTHRVHLASTGTLTWTGSGAGFDTIGAVLVLWTGTPATSILAGWLDFQGTVSVQDTNQLIIEPDPDLGWLFGGLLAAS